ncbi:ADP-ribosylglycohydrolase family protein [Paenibacillus sp. N3.4]|uniref:ADP-ribosylglycohydrolase family protein n=1 Tax=Paenibacillus sp. N3.4 TaxID=2603222 RepID=UPI0011C834D2|nr:ADP-ribosylglycohydrolase family protein [Paenibacillus sp. N3.4]TXK68923.1 ADP-ribosylglycohydrolase family protein [Paenibacillus sp. N3.4]
MSIMPNNYVEKVYAGWLGKIIGVRHGANIEGWSYDRIKRTFGEITGYLHEFKNFAADDDTNGPIAFLRALEDYTYTNEITSEQMGKTWLNYSPDGHGLFWWGGYGTSTEHTAYYNLKKGINAPRSGSIEQNGATVAEQIGGQIFIDVWGLIAPGNPRLAAEYAEKIASVSHDGNGKYGGMFIAACIAAAFIEKDIEILIETGLSFIPADCEYERMTRLVMDFYRKNPQDWRACFQYIHDNFGYDRYPGNCHIIPNAAVIILSLLYGNGDFSATINICNMCGWDTDCNVANVGTIMGVRNGLEGIDNAWRTPINDFLCCSTVVGKLNILDIPWCASYIANFGYKIAGEEIPNEWKSILLSPDIWFHFEYPGSTHAFRLESDAEWQVTGKIENTTEAASSGKRSLKIIFDKVQGGGYGFRTYHQTYYRPEDFNDSRYDPSFSPILYPGQTLDVKVMVPTSNSMNVQACLYVKNRNEDYRHYCEKVLLVSGEWTTLNMDIPFMSGACLIEAGVEFIPMEGNGDSLIAYLDDFVISGKPNYEVDFSKERLENWNVFHIEVSQFTYLRGLWTLENGELSGSYHSESAECYTGDLSWANYMFDAHVIPKLGEFHNIQFRVQGAIRSYAAGFAPNNRVVLYKNDNGYVELASAEYAWSYDEPYQVQIEANENKYKVMVNGELLIIFTDVRNPYLNGQVGFSNFEGSHTHYKRFSVKGI